MPETEESTTINVNKTIHGDVNNNNNNNKILEVVLVENWKVVLILHVFLFLVSKFMEFVFLNEEKDVQNKYFLNFSENDLAVIEISHTEFG